ncbi:MAG TPA: serine hydrolase [Cyclobacteriaceae bacterium]|nr:serine hydrolase [Cyclobacteriaceae bacterium]
MTRSAYFLILIIAANGTFAQKQKSRATAETYYPGSDTEWKKKSPADAGMNKDKLQDAIAFSVNHEVKNPRDMEQSHYQSFGRTEPFGEGIGPFKVRGNVSGVVLKGGYIVAEWGEPFRVDMTHSVTKSFLSTVIGVAFDKGLIRSVNDTVWRYVPPILPYDPMPPSDKASHLGHSQWITPFETPHNRKITWDHLLRQVSDWEGTLWGKSEWADRPGPKPEEWQTRDRLEPGKAYEYNDVRVNVLSLAALSVWRKPLPVALKEHIMDPIGSSNTWRWYGYENSFVIIDGQIMQSVSGGGHWGGGMVINARDMARFGYLTLRRGKWKDKQLLSEAWVKMATTPTPAQPTYGFMNWFLNTDKKLIPAAPATSFYHLGNGTNAVYVDPENDLVVVVRWIESNALPEFIEKVLASIER